MLISISFYISDFRRLPPIPLPPRQPPLPPLQPHRHRSHQTLQPKKSYSSSPSISRSRAASATPPPSTSPPKMSYNPIRFCTNSSTETTPSAILDEYHFSVNEKRVEEQVLICDALNSYLDNGCLCDDVKWQELGNTLCNGFQNNQRTASDKNEEKSFAPAKMALAVPAVFFLRCALICPCFHAKNKKANEKSIMFSQVNSMNSVSIDISSTSEKAPGTPSRFLMSQQENKIGTLQLSVNQIIKVTKNFSNPLKVCEGGYGAVYKAVLPNGQIVAMKRAKKDLFASPINEFSNEVELLTKIDHRNLVRLLGYTDKGDERIIITEYVPNGTLRGHLGGQYGKILNFNERFELAIDKFVYDRINGRLCNTVLVT